MSAGRSDEQPLQFRAQDAHWLGEGLVWGTFSVLCGWHAPTHSNCSSSGSVNVPGVRRGDDGSCPTNRHSTISPHHLYFTICAELFLTPSLWSKHYQQPAQVWAVPTYNHQGPAHWEYWQHPRWLLLCQGSGVVQGLVLEGTLAVIKGRHSDHSLQKDQGRPYISLCHTILVTDIHHAGIATR